MRTRFAPAPTGHLHLGHVVNAIFVWGAARAFGARVLLRIEDHDRQRCRPEYEAALLDDLDWLGFEPDDFPTSAFRAGACESRQSDRDDVYQAAAQTLMADGLVYGCDCRRLDLIREPGDADDRDRRYPGTCRDRGLPLTGNRTWRVRIEPGIETFQDLLVGRQTQNPSAEVGDVAIRDRLGNWTYQFVASVDDWRQDVTLVVRGLDLVGSTGRQIRIARLLGRPAMATFAHHPLVMKSPDQKLSKSDGDTGVCDRRAEGWSAARVIGEAARRIQLSSTTELSADEAATLSAARITARRS